MKYNYGDWTPIIEDYENIDRTYKCKPDITKFPKCREGDIIDENQTVKWNREEVARRIQAYKNEVGRLNTERNAAFTRWRQNVTDMITVELLGRRIFKDTTTADKKALIIYNQAYEDAHSYGVYDVLQKVDAYVDFVEEMLK